MAKTQISKEVQAEVKAQRRARNGNTIMDMVLMGGSAFLICALAGHELLRHIQAAYPVNFGLAALAIGVLLYQVIAPMFRRR